jgi:hypothetical protein
MVRDRKNPYAPSAADGNDGSYERPPGKFALTDALGSSGRSAVAPKKKKKPTSAGAGDKPETTDTDDEPAEMEAVAEAIDVAPPAPQEAPSAPAQKLPRLDLGRRSGKP